MCFIYTCFFTQVFFVVNTHASNVCVSFTLSFLHKYFSSSIHMLLMHVFHLTCFFTQVFFITYYMDDDSLHLDMFWKIKIGIASLDSFYFINVLNGGDYKKF
jgi:hypothetical protein